MKILFYKLTYDTGFAPNPFGDYLTLATCTPNHARANLEVGDYIIGIESQELANKRKNAGWRQNVEQSLIYIAKVDEILKLDEYFKDERFSYKKYQKSGDWTKRRGDNVYYIENDTWKWIRGHDHDVNLESEKLFFKREDFDNKWQNEKEKYGVILQDIRGNRVFISKDFSYFGDMYIETPNIFKDYTPNRGIKYCYDNDENFIVIMNLIHKLQQDYGKGKKGNPIYCHIEDYCKDNKEIISTCKK